MLEQELRRAWQEPAHAVLFDARAKLSPQRLRQDYERFNEFRMFMEHKGEIRGRGFVEIGCATGELNRYLRHFHPEFRYRGFDISHPAIERARQKYPGGQFETCQPDLSDVLAANLSPAVAWARDVVHHQPDPFAYLSKLLQISREVTILRLRTRDHGATVLDPDASCQWHYNHWVPYIVLNIDETLDAISRAAAVSKIYVVKHYVQLGGWHGRFLPKECYYPETGTAETAVYVARAGDATSAPEVVVTLCDEVEPPRPLLTRVIHYLGQRVAR